MDILTYGFMQRAIMAGLVVACVCSLIGVFLVLKRLSLIGEGLAHTSLGGVALGLFLGWYPLAVAVPFTIAGALGIHVLSHRFRLYGDAAIAILFAAGLSLGVILLSVSHGFNADLFSYLFGSILAISPTDLYAMGALGAVVLATLALLYRRLLYVTFDEDAAAASGIPVGALNLVLVMLTGATVVVAVQLVGVLMVSSLLVVPAATSLQVARSFRQMLIFAISVAIVAVMVGLAAAHYLDLAPGGAIVMASVTLFIVVGLGRVTLRWPYRQPGSRAP